MPWNTPTTTTPNNIKVKAKPPITYANIKPPPT